MRILVVEDDELISSALEKTLSGQNYIVDLANNGQIGWELVEAFIYDLVILDIVLPKLDGIRFCRQLRESGYQIPVMLLTAQNSSNDKVMGLDAGADDYVVKPFDLTELLARIRVLLRRSSACNPVILQWGSLCFDPGLCKVTYEGQTLSLTPKEYRLLELFLRNHHRVFSRSDILDHLWPSEQAPSEDAVTVHIKDLRQKLKRAGGSSNFIETVYGQGYRLKQYDESQEESSLHSQTRQTNEQIKTELAVIWEKYRGLNHNRLELLEKAAAALLKNNLKETQCKIAHQVAHKLAGALGIFGFSEGSCLAKEIEEIFKNYKILGSFEAHALSESLKNLRGILDRSQDNLSLLPLACPLIQRSEISTHSIKSYPLLLISDDMELAKRFSDLARTRCLSVEIVTSLPEILSGRLTDAAEGFMTADVVILSLSLQNVEEKDLARLAKITNQIPPMSVLCLTTQNDVENQVKMNRLATHVCFQKPQLLEQVVDAVIKRRSQLQSTAAKVMFVDDDEAILTGMRSLLEPLGLNLTTLNDPLQFLPVLEKSTPDLLVLDLKMPHFSGLDLCQVLRNTPQWSSLPILFLTAHADMHTTNQIFSAGANGCISKTIGQPALATRILSCLERARLHRSFANCIDQ
jgi:DNA-binding response OmpR family regulator/HPt (histidine-containing phosphotransfer) domain-containing protein